MTAWISKSCSIMISKKWESVMLKKYPLRLVSFQNNRKRTEIVREPLTCNQKKNDALPQVREATLPDSGDLKDIPTSCYLTES